MLIEIKDIYIQTKDGFVPIIITGVEYHPEIGGMVVTSYDRVPNNEVVTVDSITFKKAEKKLPKRKAVKV